MKEQTINTFIKLKVIAKRYILTIKGVMKTTMKNVMVNLAPFPFKMIYSNKIRKIQNYQKLAWNIVVLSYVMPRSFLSIIWDLRITIQRKSELTFFGNWLISYENRILSIPIRSTWCPNPFQNITIPSHKREQTPNKTPKPTTKWCNHWLLFQINSSG